MKRHHKLRLRYKEHYPYIMYLTEGEKTLEEILNEGTHNKNAVDK